MKISCKICEALFEANPNWHHSTGMCSDSCRKVRHNQICKEYDKTEKGKAAEMRWRKSQTKKRIDYKYRQTDKGRRSATQRTMRAIAKNPNSKAIKARLDRLYRWLRLNKTGKHAEWWQSNVGRGCFKCGTHRALTIDHLVPRSKGGSDEVENLQILCRHCNGEKGVKIISYAV